MLNIPSFTLFNAIIVLLTYVILSASGLTLIKAAPGMMSVSNVAGFFLYALGFLIWVLVILRMFPLSFGFPVSAGSLIIATQISGYAFLNENYSLAHFLGIGLILIGISLVFFAGDYS